MPSSLIEQLRIEAINDLFRLQAFSEQWPLRRNFFLSKLGRAPDQRDITRLGDFLSDAFRITGVADRSQSSVSGAGSTWEALIVWYFNLCLLGTHAVCVRGPALCPRPINEALTLTYESSPLRSEPDVVLLSSRSLAEADATPNRSRMKTACASVLNDSFEQAGVVNFQCKTNWNDNAQIPMLWNMLYAQTRQGTAVPGGFLIGTNLRSIRNLGHFSYGFVTVPTTRGGPESFRADRLSVQRVRAMTAGNYWGYPTRSGVASSLRDFFDRFSLSSQVFPNVADVGRVAAAELNAETSGASSLSPFRLSPE